MTEPALPLPMFPLGIALVPYAGLPLHLFEPRYRALGRDLLRGNGEFGVVLIERGSEVGGGEVRARVGTAARVVEAVAYDDGRWDLLAVGTHRIEVDVWLPDDPYPVALVRPRPDVEPEDDDPGAAGAIRAAAEQVVRQAVALRSELGEGPAGFDLSADPVRAAWELVAVAPLGPFDRQALLTIDDPVRRLSRLRELAEDARAVLAYRLAGG